MMPVVLIMERAPVAQGLLMKAQHSSQLKLYYEPDYAAAGDSIRRYGAGAALVEAAESGEHNMSYCLSQCAQLRRSAPDCRLLLMCPEIQRQAVQQAISAKREHLLDDFVFYDASLEYLTANLQAL